MPYAAFADIPLATLAARQRTGDDRISVAVKRGRFQVQIVTYHKRTTTIQRVTEWLDAHATVAALGCDVRIGSLFSGIGGTAGRA